MKRRNFFKVLGAAVVAPTVVKAEPKRDSEGWGKITPYKHSDPIPDWYERHAKEWGDDYVEIVRNHNALMQMLAKRKA